MSEVIERGARAIYAASPEGRVAMVREPFEVNRPFWEAAARAAIAAMRKPTAAMRNAVGPWIAYPGGGWSDDECDSLIEEVIDAALISERGSEE